MARNHAGMLGYGLRQLRMDYAADVKKEDEMNEIMTGMPAMLLLTLASYLLGVFFQKSTKISVLHPFITAMVIIIATLFIFDIPYESYREGNRILDFLLGPSVVALALKLYDNLDIVRKNLAAILSAVVTGSVVGIVGVWAIGRMMSCTPEFIKSLEAKSVSTPIAMDITGPIGGSTSLVAISVVITGVLGAVLGPSLLKILGITDPVAKGVSMGCASHGVGTGRAIELGAIEGAVSGLCIVLMGVATSLLVPILNILLGL
ncbi:MAG: LrgB family protein [Bacteroidales bacterium]|nr:LrgB family protein [Candidatus Cryptobacteroides caccocaballi]